MPECLCVSSQDRYADGSYARSYTLDVSPDCPHHGPVSDPQRKVGA